MSGAQIHRQSDRRFSPWKNGGGETAEILCAPPGAGFEAFDWRISTAKVAQDGPFSGFEGVDRVLTLLEGGPMTLAFPEAEVRLVPGSAPLAFAGERPCRARLEGGPVLDLNLMVRRPLTARVLAGPARPAAEGRVVAAFVFACTALPALGLARHDLLDLGPALPETLPEGALLLIVGA